MQLFYCQTMQLDEGILEHEEAFHCSKVLRKKPGDVINVTDGTGCFYTSRLITVSPKKCTFQILERENTLTPSYTVHIVIAPTKNFERMEWFVEKAVEIGIHEISFLQSEHSERLRVNLERIRKKAISAMKQSVRNYLPVLNDIQTLNEFLKSGQAEQKFVAHLDEKKSSFLQTVARKAASYIILIGPEGGFSSREIDLLYENDYLPVRLGEYRLRTETAGLAACMTLNMINQA